MKVFFFFFFAMIVSSCSTFVAENDDLQTMPVTNNPLIVPNHGTGLGSVSSH